jgi:hypothetical protein
VSAAERLSQPTIADAYGRLWPLPMTELCVRCRQPDNTGDCNHEALSAEDAQRLGCLLDASAVIALGYRVELIPKPDDDGFRYEIHGARGAHYALMPNVHNPHHLFAVNMRGFTKTAKVGGYEWFSDEGGRLRPLR